MFPIPAYPVLITRLAGAFLHYIVLPSAWPEDELLRFARWQATANRLKTCLALGEDRALYLEVDDAEAHVSQPPWSDKSAAGLLQPVIDLPLAGDNARRAALVDEAVRRTREKGGVLIDVYKSGRAPTPDERAALAGRQADGSPRGLVRCTTCGERFGRCIDPNPLLEVVVTVNCRCEPLSLCARCLRPLYHRRLDSNYYNPQDGAVWHVPGFCGITGHCCMGIDVARAQEKYAAFGR